MTIKSLLASILLTLLALSVVAYCWRPKKVGGELTPLVWVSDNSPTRAEQIAVFNHEYPKLDLSLDYGNTQAEKIIMQCISGVGPDVFDLNYTQLQMYVEAGVLWDITDAARQAGVAADQATWPAGQDVVTYFGRQYGYPRNIGSYILIYNKNLFDYFGVPYPPETMTWEEFVETARKVNTTTTGKAGKDGPIYAVTALDWKAYFMSQQGQYFDEQGRPQLAGNAALRSALAWHRDLIFKEKVALTTVAQKAMSGQGGWGSEVFSQFADNRFAMILGGNYALIALGRAYDEQVRELRAAGKDPDAVTDPLERPMRLGCVVLPHMAGQEPHYEVGCEIAGINAASPHREQALAFLQYLAGPSYARLINREEDFLPGNPQHAQVGVKDTHIPPALAPEQMHEVTTQAMAHGFTPRRSRFLLTNDVTDLMKVEVSRMESDPALSIDALLDDAQAQVERLIARNLNHNVDLKKEYTTLGASVHAMP